MSKSMKVCATFSLFCHTNVVTVGTAASHFSRPFELHLSTQIKYELRHTRKKETSWRSRNNGTVLDSFGTTKITNS